MFFDTIIFIAIFFLIMISSVGYGILFSKYIINYSKPHESLNLGLIGILGLMTITFISYLTNFIYLHNYLHNSILILIGAFFFIYYFYKNKIDLSKKFYFLLLVSLLYLVALFISKNHDDFGYYHLPFSLSLTEHKTIFGIGNLNLGYRHHSSLLYLNSIFYLPFVKYYLFHSSNLIIFIFVNYYLLRKILKNYQKKINFIFLLNLLFFILINVKFTRISEFGTDIAGQLILVIFFNLLINIKNISLNLFLENDRYKDLYLISFIFIFLMTLKVYFVVYFLFLLFIYKEYFHLIKKKFS